MQLIPGTTHAITWSKQNLLDTSTYYVRAVVRDTRTETVLATLDLVDLDNGRYSYPWTVVGDPSGRGREIEIEKTVYEDSGYTQVSGMYGRWLDQYVILDPRSASVAPGGANYGGTVDYEHIARLVAKEVQQAVSAIPQTDLSTLAGELGGVKQTLGERLRELLRLGKKASEFEQLEARLGDEVRNLTTAIATARRAAADIERAGQAAASRIGDAAAQAGTRIADTAADHEQRMSAKFDEELTHVVEQFKRVAQAEAQSMADVVSERITAELDKPLQVQTLQTATARRNPPTDDTEGGDQRVKRLMQYAS